MKAERPAVIDYPCKTEKVTIFSGKLYEYARYYPQEIVCPNFNVKYKEEMAREVHLLWIALSHYKGSREFNGINATTYAFSRILLEVFGTMPEIYAVLKSVERECQEILDIPRKTW